MPKITRCTTQLEIKAAYDGYNTTIEGQKEALGQNYGGYVQMAKDFYNGVDSLLFANISKKQQWYKMTEDEGALGEKITGLLRIEIHPDSVHIAQVTAVGGGKWLVEKAREVARSENKSKVDLSTADVTLPGYYKRLGFEMVSAGAKTGEMVGLASWDGQK
jgi:hypothetical protein